MAGHRQTNKTGSATQNAAARYLLIDLWRGIAVLFMIAYHLCFDLAYFNVLKADFNHQFFWLTARTLIVSVFLLLVGISLILARQQKNFKRNFWMREVKLIGCALLVSLGSYLVFPDTFIFFGILHFIAVASLLTLGFVRFYWMNLGLGAIWVLIGINFESPLFNQPWLQWVGLMTYKPFTEDYVPLFPWFGVVLIGLFVGKLISREQDKSYLNRFNPCPQWRWIIWLGRHSLLIYMVHQPIIMGLLWVTINAYSHLH